MSRSEGATYIVSGVCCATEEAVLRKTLNHVLGKETYRFNLATCELYLPPGVSDGAVLRGLRQAGFDGRHMEAPAVDLPFLQRHRMALTAGASSLALAGGMIAEGNVGTVLCAVAIAIGGWRILRRAAGALRARTLDMNVLMAVAVIGALAIGKWEEGAAVVALFTVALMLESYSNERTRRALRSLMSLSPARASVAREGVEETLPVEQILPGDVVVIRPGERIPLDGTVIEGSSDVNEAPVTGEAFPVTKSAGSPVYAGTLSGTGMLRVRVTMRAGDSTIARIGRMIEEAQLRRAPVQTLVDRVARIYTPAVLAVAIVVALIPPVIFGADQQEWLYRALVLLVIACPCALVIATPVAIVSAMTRAAWTGVLIKGGIHVESLAGVRTVALDKTGTLTMGMPRVTDVVPFNGHSRHELLQIAGALERHSEHHLASAAVAAAQEAGTFPGTSIVEGFKALPGRGVTGVIDGTTYYLGNRVLSEEAGYYTAGVGTTIDGLSAAGKTAIILGTARGPLGIVGFRDGMRSQGRHALERMREMGITHVVMLSGDSPGAAGEVAAHLGIDDVRPGLLPQDKVTAIDRLKKTDGSVAMVGDGINDAPALAAASVGIAMGVAGSDAALETADVVLMSDNLSHLPYIFGLSRATMRVVRQNIGLAITVKLLFLALAVAGHASLWMAVLADDGASLAVIVNALRVLRYKETDP